MKKITLASLLLLSVGLTGCSSNDEEEEKELVLPEIVNQFESENAWQTSVGSGVEHYFSRLSPVVYKDTVFVASRNGIVKAIDIKTGNEAWRTDLRVNPSFLPWEDDDSAKLAGGLSQAYGKIFIGSELGEIIALDRETGDIAWRKKVPGEALSAPAAGDGLLYVNLGSGKLIALHPDECEQRWVYEHEIPALTLRGISSPKSANGGVIFGEENGKLSVLVAESGYLAWQADVAVPQGASEFERLADVDTQPVIAGSTVYSLAYNGNLAAVDIRSGNVLWKRQYSGYREFTLDGRNIYLVDSDGTIYALDSNSGIERWSQPALNGWFLTGPTVFGEYLVTGDQEGHLHWLDKETGELVSRSEFDSSGFYVEPIIADDKLVVITRDGEVSLVNLPVKN
jgi:outer membrane protein assembly factor BamB